MATTATGELAFPQMTPMGGAIQGMDVLASDGVSGQIIAVDASQIAAAAGTVELDGSGAATVQWTAHLTHRRQRPPISFRFGR